MNIKCFIAVLAVAFIDICSFAQNNVNSPYTMFGVGYIEPGGFGRNKAMGGAGIALPSEMSLNNINPASYSSLDSLHFILETGVTGLYSRFTKGSQSQVNHNANFSYLAVGFRITKWWANSIGLVPFSNTGYSIDTQKQIEGSNDFSNVNISGSGGVNQFYWGNSFKINKNFSVGVNASYLFGSISKVEKTTSDLFSGSMIVEDESRLNNFYFTYGAQYSFKINSDWSGRVGGVFGARTKLIFDEDINVMDSNRDTLTHDVVKNSDFHLPMYYGFGASLKFKNRFVITGDYTQNNWSDEKNTVKGVKLVNSNNIAFGMELLPSYKPSAGYFQIVKYRLGGYYEKSYMKINGEQMLDYGVTAGMGLPILKGKTYINVAFSVGMKGVPGSKSIINENYYKLNLNFSLFDFWFNRIKYD